MNILKLVFFYFIVAKFPFNFFSQFYFREWNKELEKLKTLTYQAKNGTENCTEKLQSEPSLARAIFRTFFWDNIKIMLILILESSILRLLLPVFLGKVTDYFNTKTTEKQSIALCYGFGLVVALFGISFCMHHYFFYCDKLGYKIRVACSSLIYKKVKFIEKFVLKCTIRI